jgi:shikimate kinase
MKKEILEKKPLDNQQAARYPTDRTVVLVGLMGAGKSTIGKRLAARLEMPFIDADSEIEKAAGMSISEIFEQHGEEAFREGESKVICRLLKQTPHVLATGGGAFMNEKTRDEISRVNAVSIWLKADIEILLKRVGRRSNRPLLNNSTPRQVLERLRREREPVYALADITVESNDVPHDQVVDIIIGKLATYRANGEPIS